MLPPTMWMNKTCVMLTTANLTFYDSKSGGNLTNCVSKKPSPTATDNLEVGITLLRVSLISMLLVFMIFSFIVIPYHDRRLIRKLRNMPAHQLHRELDEWYANTLSKKKRKAFSEKTEDGGGRYPDVVFSTDRFTKRKRVVITENLNEEPTEQEFRKYNKRVIMKAKRAMEFPSLTVRELDGRTGTVLAYTASNFASNLFSTIGGSNTGAAPQTNVGNGDQGAPEIYLDAPPPSYRHSWRGHV